MATYEGEKLEKKYSVQVQENVYFPMFNVPKPSFNVKSYHVIPLSIEMCRIKKDQVSDMINRRKLKIHMSQKY